jgi:hypothetical protein
MCPELSATLASSRNGFAGPSMSVATANVVLAVVVRGMASCRQLSQAR